MTIEFDDNGVFEGRITKDEFINHVNDNWREYADEKDVTHPSTAHIKNFKSAIHEYVNGQDLIGRKTIKPKEGDSPEIWNKYYKDIGIPMSETEYQISSIENMPKEIDKALSYLNINKKDFIKYLNDAPPDERMNNKAAQKAWQFFENGINAIFNNYNEQTNNTNITNKEKIETLLGGKDSAEMTLKNITNFVNLKDNTGTVIKKYGNDPDFITFVNSIVPDYDDDDLKVKSTPQNNVLDKKSQITKYIMENRDAYYNATHPQHKSVKAKVDSMQLELATQEVNMRK